ncbi:hypothetical protein C8N43_0309 [Litoreibacter ponti]|uniref:Uncharacterized protein n=1 Tax=Litoreibacter ponti TaxID=1510457 RepID=A0A2T6BHY4_9RHOB|nr:hypothetical protein C8N43_0309 [Litoreibacter ponti]
MCIQMDEAESCPRFTCFGHQPFERFRIRCTLLKSFVQRSFCRDEPLPGSYGVCLHLRPDRLDILALLISQTDFNGKLKKVSGPWNTIELGGACESPSAAMRDFF